MRNYWTSVRGRLARESARLLCRRPFRINTQVAVISFSFDDFPRSALLAGGRILGRYGARGTYYASLGLMGKQGPPGPMFLLEDLRRLLDQGHDLGCHTFGHCHSLNTPPAAFERSVIENQLALGQLLPGASFRTLAYPISPPRPGTKRRAGRHFLCCRGGGRFQAFNDGVADLNCLSAFFLEKSRDNPDAVKALIDRNVSARGWLIFATHDVSDSPSPYGCTPRFFEDVVHYAVNSGARILPVAQACEELTRKRG